MLPFHRYRKQRKAVIHCRYLRPRCRVTLFPGVANPSRKKECLMIKRRFLLTALSATALLAGAASLAPAASASQAAGPGPSTASTASPHPAPYSGTAAEADQGAPSITGGSVPLTACTPYVNGDTVHVSSGDASSHGWWLIGNCPNVKATVTNVLQEYFSDKTWRTQATNSGSVYPSLTGGSPGSANWVVARHACSGGTVPAGWRHAVIVNIGNGSSAYVGFANLPCRT